MRVVTGTARGRKLKTPSGRQTRPTLAAVKEAVFSAIQFEMEGARVLDLFAGSGQMGIEALSRGAVLGVFVDQSEECRQVIKENLKSTGLEQSARLYCADVSAWLRGCRETFDFVFIDPPYESAMVPKVLKQVSGMLRPGGAVFCESANEEALPQTVENLEKAREYHFGKTKVTRYEYSEQPKQAEE